MRLHLYVFCAILFFSGCYSFKGISIPADVKTFYINPVKLSDFEAPPDSPERFMEQLRQKIRSQSSLKENDRTPDVEFKSNITRYSITNEASSQGNEVSLNKLNISVAIEYIDNKNEDNNYKKTFSFGIPFDPSEDFNSIEDGFIEEIFEQITEQIFNDTFTNW